MSPCPHRRTATPRTSPPPLRGHEIHVWTLSLNQPVDALRDLQGILSADEKARALRFASPPLRRRHICAHAATRAILGAYLQCAPATLAIATGPAGKPHLQDPPDTGIQFNLSHAGDVALLAISRDAPVGVDIEAVRELPDWEPLAQRFLSTRESRQLHRLPPDRRPFAFFEFWVRKEAYSKGLGTGITVGLPSFSVQLGRGFRDVHDPACADIWRVSELESPEGFLAAVATPLPKARIRYFEWE